ncbi:MAG: hypothetical protein KDA85_22915, partial [Planctomycetaceae bacterium]|nr:hypothetical protein [Planctomycetaceae bacterium]
GGWAVCNFDTSPGKIDVKQPLGSTYLEEITLKGMIHELGHGFHLPHIGPLMGDDLGNTLMGPTHFNYKRTFPAGTQHVYLCEAEAAILSVHPAFNGVADSRKGLPKVQVDNLRYSTEPAKRQITVKGRLRSPAAARYALVTDQSDASPGEYWIRTYAGKIQTDGSFEVVLTEPADAGGTLRTWFVFENGALTGNGKSQGIESGIPQVYTFGRRGWEFKTNAQ